MRRTMIGTTEVFPLKTGIGSTDATVQAGRGATLLPSDLWLCEPNKGAPALQLRASGQGISTSRRTSKTAATRSATATRRTAGRAAA